MSLRQRVLRGQRAKVYRPVTTSELDASRAIRSWALVSGSFPLLIQPIGAELVGKLYGSDVVVEKTAWALPDIPPALNDRLIISRGAGMGERYRIVRVNAWILGSANDHYEIALESTEEDFGTPIDVPIAIGARATDFSRAID